ncbi:MAG: hypothetical protein Q9162_003742, partial [Coniocarpon cinnabarinum]
VTGLPGAGKSTFIKYLFEECATHELLKEWSQDATLITARHFFWAAGTAIQKSQQGLYQSLLHNVLSQRRDLIGKATPSRLEMQLKGLHTYGPWSLKELQETLQRVAELPRDGMKFCFFIDGLDEYEGSHFDLANLLKKLSLANNIKLCLASREYNVFRDILGQDSRNVLYLHRFTRSDISAYTHSSFDELHEFCTSIQLDDIQRDSLVEIILNRAQGVFLWVSLVIESLRQGLSDGDSFADLEYRLDAMPTQLKALIEKIFYSIEAKPLARLDMLLCLKRCEDNLRDFGASIPLLVLEFIYVRINAGLDFFLISCEPWDSGGIA